MSLPPPPAEGSAAPPRRGLRDALPVPWPWWEAILVYLIGAFVLGGGAAALVFSISRASGIEIVGSAVADLVFLGAMLSWLGRRSPDWRERLRTRWDSRQAQIGTVLGLLLYPAVALIAVVVIRWVLEQVSGAQVNQPQQLPEGLSLGFTVLTVVLVVVIAPVTEELFYRGVLYRSLRDRHGRALALVASSTLFGLAHYVPAPAADALFLQTVMICTGLGLAAIYEWRGSLVANIFAHATFNTIGMVLILTST